MMNLLSTAIIFLFVSFPISLVAVLKLIYNLNCNAVFLFRVQSLFSWRPGNLKKPQPSYFSFNSIIENPKMKVYCNSCTLLNCQQFFNIPGYDFETNKIKFLFDIPLSQFMPSLCSKRKPVTPIFDCLFVIV